MLRKSFYLPLIAGGMLVFAIGNAMYIQRREPDTSPPAPPPTTPYGNTVAGIGIVEPSTEASTTGAIAIGSQLAGVVVRVDARIGQTVKAGDLLFELDSRQADAKLKVQMANVIVSEAQVQVAEATLRQMADQNARAEKIAAKTPGAIAEQDVVTAKQNFLSATGQVALAKANVEQSRAQVEQAKIAMKLLQVRAPVDGTILQVNVRTGEFISVLGGQSLILMGNLNPLHVRVSIDEEDFPRLLLQTPANAKIRGGAGLEVPLTFVRLEPYVVPKLSLRGINTERVDTRVVHVIYAVASDSPAVRDRKLLVGQLVDVFIEANRPRGEGVSSAISARAD